MLVPGLSYPLETFVESLSDKGISDIIKVSHPWGPVGEAVRVSVGKVPSWPPDGVGICREAFQPPLCLGQSPAAHH